MATAVLSMAIFIFGDIFDSAGIPRLVRTLHEKGEESFRELAGSVVTFACVLSAALCLLLFAAAPLTPWIAPGFDPARKAAVVANLLWLAPMAVLYLPYHSLGSVLRAKRRFLAFHTGDLIIAAATLAVILAWHDRPHVVPLSFSAAYVVVFAYVAVAARREVRFPGPLRSTEFRAVARVIPSLVPLYLTGHAFTVVDRVFASYLPSGSVSALSYGFLIATIPCSILMMDAVFITPLAEAKDRGAVMGQIVTGTIILSVPVAVFATAYADQIVKAAFERGAFTAVSTRATAQALAWFAAGIPAFFFWPVCYRLFQVLEQFRLVGIAAAGAVALNACFNLVFMKMGMGIAGLALATSIAAYGLVAAAAVGFWRLGIAVFDGSVAGVLAVSLAISAAALGAAFLVPAAGGAVGDLFLRGAVFAAVAGGLFFVVPHRAVRTCRDTIVGEIAWRKGKRARG